MIPIFVVAMIITSLSPSFSKLVIDLVRQIYYKAWSLELEADLSNINQL